MAQERQAVATLRSEPPHRGRISLDLKTVDLCFLAGLHLRADRAALASFEGETLTCGCSESSVSLPPSR